MIDGQSTLSLGCTYLYVKDMDVSRNFYDKLLDMAPTHTNQDRWAQYNFNGNCIALMNKAFDDRLFKSEDGGLKVFDQAYIDYFKGLDIQYGNHVVLNFWTDDLTQAYSRIRGLNIGEVSDIMLVQFKSPYYFFIIKDPDGNVLEMNGHYQPE